MILIATGSLRATVSLDTHVTLNFVADVIIVVLVVLVVLVVFVV
jgi:hypothetical protein